MSWIGVILLPFTFLYSMGVRLRNHLFDIGYTRSIQFDVPVILAGNLSAGGTGKTPMVEYLVRMLLQDYRLAILSRGYKRKTQGFRVASNKDSSSTIGDEPMQYFQRWGQEITVTVGEDRVEAIPRILFDQPETNVILMDDGFQHRHVSPDLKILLTDYSKPFYEDFLLPSGRLREPRKEAKRADIIVVTKCPAKISTDERDNMTGRIESYSRKVTPIFFSSLIYDRPEPVIGGVREEDFENVILFSGIANPEPFENYASSKWNVISTHRFRDHHEYGASQLEALRDVWRNLDDEKDKTVLLTTEKDAVKLHKTEIQSIMEGVPVYSLPIRMHILENGSDFEDRIRQAISLKAKN